MNATVDGPSIASGIWSRARRLLLAATLLSAALGCRTDVPPAAKGQELEDANRAIESIRKDRSIRKAEKEVLIENIQRQAEDLSGSKRD